MRTQSQSQPIIEPKKLVRGGVKASSTLSDTKIIRVDANGLVVSITPK